MLVFRDGLEYDALCLVLGLGEPVDGKRSAVTVVAEESGGIGRELEGGWTAGAPVCEQEDAPAFELGCWNAQGSIVCHGAA